MKIENTNTIKSVICRGAPKGFDTVLSCHERFLRKESQQLLKSYRLNPNEDLLTFATGMNLKPKVTQYWRAFTDLYVASAAYSA